MPVDIKVMRVYQYIGGTVLLALAGVMPFLSDFLKIFESIPRMQLILYSGTVVLLLLWVWSTWYELNHILYKWVDPKDYALPQGFLVVAMIAVMVCVLALLFVTVPKIDRYVAVFTIYSLCNLYTGGIYTQSQIAYAVQETKKQASAEYSRIALDAIKDYWVKHLEPVKRTESIFFPYKVEQGWRSWFKNPYFIRLFICFAAGLALLPVPIIAKHVNSAILEQVSYVTMFLILLVSEIVIGLWRLKRDQRILKAEIIASKEGKTGIDKTDCE